MLPQHLTQTMFAKHNLPHTGKRNSSFPKGNYLVRAYQVADTVALLLALFVIVPMKSRATGLAGVLAQSVTVESLLLLFAYGLLWNGLCRLCRLYDDSVRRNYREEAARIAIACTLGSLAILGFSLVQQRDALNVRAIASFWLFSMAALLVARHILHILNPEWTPAGIRARRLLIVGSGPRALSLYRELRQADGADKFIGFVDSRNPQEVHPAVAARLLGGLEELEAILTGRVVDEVLIALPIKSCYSQIQAAIRTCELVGVECKYLSDIFNFAHARPRIEGTRRELVISLKMVSDDYRQLIKRAVDIVGAAAALILFSPLMLLAAIAVKLTSEGPIVFVQERYGLNKRRFRMFKFRTMVINAETLQAQLEDKNEAQGPVFKIKNDPRITSIGRFLRKASIDELPQLFNVLRGDMSLVGPRPLPERDVNRFSEASLLRRFSVKPGLTCLWQVSGRSNTDFEHWIKQDLQYIDEWSLGLDLAILFKTMPAVVKGRGAV